MRLMRLFLISSVLMPASIAFADTETKEADCETQAAIVSLAVDMRQDGKREKRAIRTITKDDLVTERWEPAVPHLVGWVYTLPKPDLEKDPGSAYLDACLKQ